MFGSIKPHIDAANQIVENTLTVGEDTEIKGQCLKTAQSSSKLKSSHTHERFYHMNIPDKKLSLMKSENGAGKKTHSLSELKWVDSTLTDTFDDGFSSIFQREGIPHFLNVSVFKFPIVMGMADGSMMILWFEF